MALFGQKEPERVSLEGFELRCEICKHERFWRREAQRNTPLATFFNFDGANATAVCFT